MKVKTINNGIRLENDNGSLEITIINEKWVTVHPNGKENKGRHLLIKDGETLEEAVERTYKEPSFFGKDVDLGKDKSSKTQRINYLKEKVKEEWSKTGDADYNWRKLYKHEQELGGLIGEDAVSDLRDEFEAGDEEESGALAREAKYKAWQREEAKKAKDKPKDYEKEEVKEETKIEEKEETKSEEKKTIDNIEDFVVSRSNGGYYASAKETRIYKNGNSTAIVEELEGGSYAVELKRNGVSIAYKYYTTKSGAEKALKEHLAGFEAKKLEKTNLDEKRKAYEDIKKAYEENNSKRWHAKDNNEYLDAWEKAEVAKKALTKARREYAESIMANFEEVSENPYEERQQARKERYEELSGKAQEKSDAISKSAFDRLGAIPFGEPIHSREDRNRREKIWSQFGKSYEEQQKAEHYAEKAKSVGTAGISSDDANAIAKLAVKYNSGTIDSAEKRRIIDRVIDIDKRNRMLKQQAESGEKQDYSDLGFNVERNGDINRLQLKFSGIPSGDIRAKLKSHGFRWSPREGAWQRQLSTNAEWSFKRLVKELRKKGE